MDSVYGLVENSLRIPTGILIEVEFQDFRMKKQVYFPSDKGQLISKCPFDVIIWTKIPTKKFDPFSNSRVEIVKFFRWYFGPNDNTKRIF